MKQFIGRKQELQALETAYQQQGFQMTIVYGRRRLGKSTLLQQFVRDKKCVFYTAIRSSIERNLTLLGQRILQSLSPSLAGMSFDTLDQMLLFLTKESQKERLILVIDEFPYLAEQDPSILSVLQKYIDTQWLHGELYLILCGSSVSFMEDEVLSEKSPLFGRRTSQIRLEPFSYLEAAEFVPRYTAEEKAICYGVTGGVAKYLSLLDDAKPLDNNIIDLFFSKAGYLFEEPSNLLTQEFRNISTYSAVIEAVASGKTKQSEIADATHLDVTTVSHALHNLLVTNIIKKELAITEESNKKKTRYTLADTMFKFWYRFIPGAIDIISMGKGKIYYDTVVRPNLSDYMGPIFETMCRYYTLLQGIEGRFNCLITKVGRWWGTNPQKKEETDIDVVGLDPIGKNAVLGECKFKNEILNKKVFEALKERDGLIDHQYHTTQYLLFSKSGFSPWILEHASQEKILPISLETMYHQ